MKLLGAWLVFLVHTPLYWVTRVTPRRTDLWVFGAWFGDEYADNSRYLAEHIRREHPSVTCVWLCRSREVVERARENGLEACLMFSLRGYWYSARASVGFICTGRFDINFFVRPTTVINLWHGIPLKKVVAETDRTASNVLGDQGFLDNLLATLPDAYQVLNRQGIYGDFFSFYLCDVVLKLNGKGGQPVYVKLAGQDTGRCTPR